MEKSTGDFFEFETVLLTNNHIRKSDCANTFKMISIFYGEHTGEFKHTHVVENFTVASQMGMLYILLAH